MQMHVKLTLCLTDFQDNKDVGPNRKAFEIVRTFQTVQKQTCYLTSQSLEYASLTLSIQTTLKLMYNGIFS